MNEGSSYTGYYRDYVRTTVGDRFPHSLLSTSLLGVGWRLSLRAGCGVLDAAVGGLMHAALHNIPKS